MKTVNIRELPQNPAFYSNLEISNEEFSRNRGIKNGSEYLWGMTPDERLFVNGLIRFYEPSAVLEVGVQSGRGSYSILKGIEDSDATLTSIDIDVTFRSPDDNQIREIGWFAKKEFPSFAASGKHNIIAGKDPSEVLDDLDKKFDFVVLDSAHFHPVETMNFLSFLPHLCDGAIVVMHDTTGFLVVENSYAPTSLFSSISADSIELDVPGWKGYSNIVAMQINSDTKKYIRNVFNSLLLPWYGLPLPLDALRKTIERHYSPEELKRYDEACEINLNILRNKYTFPANTVFYGAGTEFRYLLNFYKFLGLPFNYNVWDKNADNIKIEGVKISLPDLSKKAELNQIAVINILDREIFFKVASELTPLGYICQHMVK
jgi:predicted O-methyltransferase YrrM